MSLKDGKAAATFSKDKKIDLKVPETERKYLLNLEDSGCKTKIAKLKMSGVMSFSDFEDIEFEFPFYVRDCRNTTDTNLAKAVGLGYFKEEFVTKEGKLYPIFSDFSVLYVQGVDKKWVRINSDRTLEVTDELPKDIVDLLK